MSSRRISANLEAFGIPAHEDHLGPFRSCAACRFESKDFDRWRAPGERSRENLSSLWTDCFQQQFPLAPSRSADPEIKKATESLPRAQSLLQQVQPVLAQRGLRLSVIAPARSFKCVQR
jgi:hypothetical protein